MEEVVLVYFIFSPSLNQYYKGSGRWVDSLNKAKKYSRRCDAKNAVQCYAETHREHPSFELQTFKLVVETNLISQEPVVLTKGKYGYTTTTQK